MKNLLRFRVGNIIGLILEESSTPSHTRRYLSNKIGLMSFGAFMKKLGRFEVFFFSCRHGSRPMPGCVPAGSELLPACQPAHAGLGAGRLGAPGGTPAGLCRPWCRAARRSWRHPCRPMPALMPGGSGVQPAWQPAHDTV